MPPVPATTRRPPWFRPLRDSWFRVRRWSSARRALPLAGRWLLILALLLAGIGTPRAPVAAQAPLPAVAAPPAASGAALPAATSAGTASTARAETAPLTATLPVSPPVAGLELALSVAPEAVGPGEPVTLTVALTNPPGGQSYDRLVLVSDLPAGVLPVPNRGDAEIVPGPQPALRWELTGLAVGTTWQGSAQVRLTGRVIDRDVPLVVEVREATPAVRAWAEAVVAVRHPRAAATIGPEGGRLESADGRIRIEVPAGAVSELVDLRYTPRRHTPHHPVFYTFDLSATAADGTAVTAFAQPLTVTLRYTDAEIAGMVEETVRLRWRSEATEGEWPSTLDSAANTLTALVSHFSTQEVTADPATIVPATIEDFQVGLFSGSASFALPLALPPGAAGLKPSLTLRYDSSRVNTMYTRYSQGGWVGIGWSLELGVVRWTDGQGDPYSIVMDGVSGQLRSENRTARDAPGAYHPRRENWVKVQFSEGRGVNQGRWEVWTTDGTKYTFGSTGASRLWTCTGTEAWKLDTITDPAGNTIEIQYQTFDQRDPEKDSNWQQRCDSPNESYPATIRYTTNAGDATAEFTVEFTISDRKHTKAGGTLLYETKKLDAIRLKNASAQIVREWSFASAEAAPPYPPTTQDSKDVLLTQITTYGTGGEALGAGNALPAMTFEYDRYQKDVVDETRTLDWCIGQLIKRQYLRAVNNGYGGRVSFDYSGWSASKSETGQCANGYQVSRRAAWGGRGEAPERVDTYSYASPTVDWSPGTAFIGFSRVTQTDPVGTSTLSQFYAVADPTAPENGLAYHTEVTVGTVIRSTQDNLYDLNTTTTWGTKPVFLLETRRSTIDETTTTRSFRTTYQYDSYGNPSQTTEYGEVQSDYITDISGDERTTASIYRSRITPTVYIVDRPVERSVYEGTAAAENQLAARTQFYYDGAGPWPDNTIGDRGQLKQERVWTGSVWALTQYQHDGLGNRIGVTDPNNNTTTTVYTSPYQGFPWKVIKPRPDGGTLTTQTDYDFTKLVVSRVSDADNQDATSYEYDNWGRLIKVIRPGDSATAPTIEYQYTAGNPLSTVTTWARESAGNPRDTASTRPSIAVYDGLGHLLETKVEGPTGSPTFDQYSVTRYTYNTRGLVETVTQPFFDGQPLTAFVGPPPDQPVTVTTYDGLGQLKTVTEPTNRKTKYSYVGGFAQVRDPLNRAVNRTTDGLGRLVEVLEYSGTGTSESPYSLYRRTRYRYTALDGVREVETTSNTGTILRKTTIGYDLRGLKTWMSDPDMGTWQYRYDPAGNLIRQANGRISPDQNVTCLFYDRLNRLIGRTFENAASVDAAQCADPGANNYIINYAYERLPGPTDDALTNNGYGRLRSVWYQGSGTGASNPQIAHTYKYDYRGRVKEEGLTTAVGTTYVLKYYYDSLDRVTKTVYPTSEQVQTTYNAMGLPATLYSITLDRQYVTGATYTAAGALASLTLLNGTRTDYRYYDEPGIDQSQRLRQLTVTKNGTTLLDLTYGYDAVSNLTGLTDATPGRAESLTLAYDAFNRLRTVSGTAYSASYTYDRLDRLTSVTEGSYSTIFGAWSAGTEANTPGQPRHAPRYIGNPSNQFGYDPAGNMTIRWLKQGGSYTAYTQKFNVDNRLYQVIGNGTTTTYDLDAHTGTTLRRTQTSGSTTTVTDFVRQYYQKNVTAGTGTVYYYFGDRLVAQQSNKLTFIHGDHLGSTVLVTDGQGGVAGRYRYHAYGRQREGSATTERRFTGQRVESATRLYDYQARYYAPALGLFVSPDPIVPEPGRPAALNRYSYVYNNPIRYTDSSGHCLDDTEWCWKNRWYNARGYFFDSDTGHWSARGTPYFWTSETYYETAITNPEVLRGETRLGFTPSNDESRALIRRYHARIIERLTDLEAFARIAEFVAGLSSGNYDTFMLHMNFFILGAGGNRQSLLAGPGARMANDRVVLRRFRSTGFAANDGGNQVNHFWYSVAIAYSWGAEVAERLAMYHEDNRWPDWLGGGGGYGTPEDLALSRQGIDLGNALQATTVDLNEVGSWLRRELAP